MAKYDPLLEHPCHVENGPIEMTFEEVDRIVGGTAGVGDEVAGLVGE